MKHSTNENTIACPLSVWFGFQLVELFRRNFMRKEVVHYEAHQADIEPVVNKKLRNWPVAVS